MTTYYLEDLGDVVSREIILSKSKYTIGAATCDIEVNSNSVLSQHAVLTNEGEFWTCHARSISTLECGERVYVNSNEISKFGVGLKHGDVISLGRHRFMFRKRSVDRTSMNNDSDKAVEDTSCDIEKEQALKQYFSDLERQNEVLLVKQAEMDDVKQSNQSKIAILKSELEELRRNQRFSKEFTTCNLTYEELEGKVKELDNSRAEAESENSKLTLSLWKKEQEVYELTIRDLESQMLVLKLERANELLLGKINHLEANDAELRCQNLSLQANYDRLVVEKNEVSTNYEARALMVECMKADVDAIRLDVPTFMFKPDPASISTLRDLQQKLQNANLQEKSEMLGMKYKELFEQYSLARQKIQYLAENELDDISQKNKPFSQETLKISQKDFKISLNNARIALWKARISRKDQEISKKNEEISQKDEITRKDEEICQKDVEISQKNEEITRKDEEITRKDEEITRKDEEICQKNEEICLKIKKISQKDVEITQKNEEISQRNEEISQKNEEISQKNEEISQKNKEISQKNKEISQKNEEISQKNLTLDSLKASYNNIFKNLAEALEKIKQMEFAHDKEISQKNQEIYLKKLDISQNNEKIYQKALAYDSLKISYNVIFKDLEEASDKINQMERDHGEALSLETAFRMDAEDKLKEKEAEMISMYQLLQNLQNSNHEKFLKHMEAEFNCAICSEMCQDAVVLNCSHCFCRNCIDAWKQNKNDCPTCRTSISHEVNAAVINRFIDKAMDDIRAEKLCE